MKGGGKVVTRIKGLDSIIGGELDPPEKGLVLTVKAAKKICEGQQEANGYGMALIPYCGVCREPLDWVYKQLGDNPKVGYLECPKCGRRWGTDISD